MKNATITLTMAIAAIALTGCNRKANEYESLCREYATLVEKSGKGIKAPSEDDIKMEVERFSALSEDEQMRLVMDAKERLREMQTAE